MKRGVSERPGPVALLLAAAGCLCLAQGITKPLLWFSGERATAVISYQENTVSSRGATWTRYRFTTQDGTSHTGTAMTGAKGVSDVVVKVAYLGLYPDLNMPAYGAYATLLGIVWSVTGLVLIGISRLFRRPCC